jgi:hypothetical protein
LWGQHSKDLLVLPTAEFPSSYAWLRIKHVYYKMYGLWCKPSSSPVKLMVTEQGRRKMCLLCHEKPHIVTWARIVAYSSSEIELTKCALFFCCCTVHSDVYTVHSPTNALLLNLEKFKIYIKIHINVAPTCLSPRPSSGRLY